MVAEVTKIEEGVATDDYRYGFSMPENYTFKSRKGIDEAIVREISHMKSEPDWMTRFRLRAFQQFESKPMPQWGGVLNDIDFSDIFYYVKASDTNSRSWDDVPAEVKDTFDRLGIPEAEKKYLAGVGAQYECLSGDSRVYTARGFIPIKEVAPGDTVFSFDEGTNQIVPARVKATAYKGERSVFEVKVGAHKIKATANHPFFMLNYRKAFGKLRGRYTRGWEYLENLRVGDLIALAKSVPDTGVSHKLRQPNVKLVVAGHNHVEGVEYELNISNRYNTVTLPEHTSDDLMWWLGLYIGDGYIHHTEGADKARVGIAVHASDPELRRNVTSVTEAIFGIAPVARDMDRVTINSTILARFLEVNDMAGTALTKRIPRWVFELPKSEKLAFLAGYIDSDGYVRDNAKNHDIMLTSVSEALLQDARELAMLSGLVASQVHRFESKHPHDKTRTLIGYRLQLSGDYSGLKCRSPRRVERLSKRKYHHNYSSAHNTDFSKHVGQDFGFGKVEAITPVGVEPVYDIEVDGPHNFVAEGFIVHNSEVVYHSLREDLSKLGVIFTDMDTAVREYPDLVKRYFSTIIPSGDNKFAALNSAVWSGGSFVYVPSGVKVDIPLQAYFRINAQNMGQFERTLIIAEPGSYVHYVEGCFLAGARVLTRGGEKAIEDVAVGDEVLTHKGRYRKVYKTMKRPYKGTVYSIQYFGDRTQTLRVTDEHPLLVVKRNRQEYRNTGFEPEWTPASEVRKGDYLAVPIPKPEKRADAVPQVPISVRGKSRNVTFPQEPDFYRLMGYYFAEGHVDNEHYLNFAFNAAERDYITDTRELVERYYGKEPLLPNERLNGQTVTLCSTEAARSIATSCGASLKEKRIPTWMIEADAQMLAELVKGMWRGDGSYDTRANMFRYNTVSRQLAYSFRDALLRLGIMSCINVSKRKAPRQDIYTVVVCRQHNAKFGELVGITAPNGKLTGSPFHMDENYMYVPIRQIAAVEAAAPVYNFSVEEDESYVCEGVVSHNCTAPTYSTNSLHSAVVEIVVLEGARVRYTTIQNWSHNVYNLVTKRAAAYKDATMEWVDGNLGCLAEGSTVTTPEGMRAIEDLQVGDKVLSYDEATGQLCFRPVRAKRFSGHQPVRTVSVGQRKLRATSNHPFFSYKYNPDSPKKLGRYNLGYVRLDELAEAIIPRTSIEYGKPHKLEQPELVTTFSNSNQYGEGYSASRSLPSRLTMPESTTDELMWLFGYWVGDGDVEVKMGKTADVVRFAKVGFSTPVADRARARVVDTMTALVDSAPTQRADGNHLSWNSKELARFFELNGFCGKAYNKRVPAWVWSLPESQRLAFIAGYLDADGMASQGRRSFSLKSCNRPLLEEISSLLVTLGLTSRIHTEFDTPREVTIMGATCVAKGSHRLEFPLDERFYGHLSRSMRAQAEACAPLAGKQKRNVGRSSIKLSEGTEIVKVDVSEPSSVVVPTWDIEVEGTGNFISQGFIVHNSKLTMKYPAVWLMEPGARGDVLSVAFAGSGQHQDAGAKMVHKAPYTTSNVVSKSISKGTGRATYRGLLEVAEGAHHCKANVKCDALLLDEDARSDTYPTINVANNSTTVQHEATVSKVGEDQLFYLMSRGISENEATAMVVNGFVEPITKEIPLEYAVELNRLIELQMEGSIG